MKIKHGKDYKNEEAVKSKYPVLGTGGIITYIDSFLCNWDCVCIGRKGTINKPIFMDIPFWSVDTLFYTKPNQNENPKFQYYLFQKINWMKYNEASGVPSLSAATIESIKINRPKINEQDKIALFLSLIDREIALQQRLIENLKLYKRGLSKQVFDMFSNGDFIPLNSICIINKGTQLNKTNMKKHGEYYVLNGGITPSGYTDNYNTESNTISISEGGNSCGFVNFNTSKFWSGGHCYTLEIYNEFNKQYLYQYLKYNESEIMQLRVGSGLPNIQKSAIENYPILKLDIPLQEKISNILLYIDQQTNYNVKLQINIEKLKTSLLQQMFI